MSSDLPDFFKSELCEYPLEKYDYQPIISQPFTVNFTTGSLFPFFISISLSFAFTK